MVAEIEFVLCDLDGVVWLAHEPIPGAARAIERLRASGRRVLFVTNNSSSLVASHEAALAAIGIPAHGDVISSAQAAATLVSEGERVMVVGGPGVFEAIEAAGARAIDPDEDGDEDSDVVDAVVVGIDRRLSYDRLTRAAAAIRSGARFVATNDDPTYPTPTGLVPGAGSIVAAVATAAGTAPTIAGKPHLPMAELARRRCGDRFRPDRALMVGDRWSTDGLFATTIGCAFALVRSGIAPPGAVIEGEPEFDVADLEAVAALVLDGRRTQLGDR